MSTGALFQDEISKTTGVGVSDWVISERVLARWWCLVAFMKATDLLHRVMRAVWYHHIEMAIKTAHKVGTCCIIVVLIITLAVAWAIQSK